MDRSNFNRFYADNVGLIHAVARKSFGRLQAIGASQEYEDLVQELTEVFIKAYDLFDAEQGKFSTYFTRSAYNRVNAIAEAFETERLGLEETEEVVQEDGSVKAVTRRLTTGVRSFEEMNSWGEDEEGTSIEETIAGSLPTPEQSAEAACLARHIVANLSPVASMVAQLAMDPPDFIEREFEAAQAHAEFARGQGVERRASRSLNMAFVCGVLERTTDLSASSLRAARLEVQDFVEKSLK